ncbi:MAG TPA: oligogalacturonate lyase family protein [Bryobacteraceae bacterium]|nr:oligogalacturonate lyase family protein [Bryobacteraceae bacterium]
MSKLWLLLPMSLAPLLAQTSDPPREWIDPDTGHRVIRLSNEPGSQSLYFHYNAYAGDKMVFTTRQGISTVDLKTRKIEPIVEGRASKIIVGRKTHQVYYLQGDTVFTTNVDTHETREIMKNAKLRSGDGFALNADETILAGSYNQNGPSPGAARPAAVPRPQSDIPPVGGDRPSLETRWAARVPMALYTINIKTGELKEFYKSDDWLNHVQMSPTDPTLLMHAHEGPWHKVDRPWLVRIDGSDRRLVHKREMDMEISGHEFFGADGKTVWYDLQTPKSKVFWLAGLVIATGERIRYKVEREHWSVHFNVSPDGKLFAGDGGGPRSVAAPGNGQWIYLFRPEGGAGFSPQRRLEPTNKVEPLIGELKAERLVNLAKHDYTLEPNVTFTPDMKWIVFRSNMHGASQVYAVEVQKSK